MSLKSKISSPVGIGPSVLQAHHLPPQLLPALEYTSSRLARKSLHLTLVAAVRDYQLPPSPIPCSPPPLGSPVTPSRRCFTRHLHLPRWGSRQHLPTTPCSSMPTSPRSILPSPPYTPMSLDFPRTTPQQLPLSPRSPMCPLTPMTPLSPPLPMTPSTEGWPSYGISPTPQHGVRLIHHDNLPPETAKTLQSILAKAGHKSSSSTLQSVLAKAGHKSSGSTYIAPALSAAACGFSKDLFNNSVTQNDVLFSSDGLTVIAPDRLYSLKAALSSYAKTGSELRLEDAVDELRRHVLASGNAKVSKTRLLRSYDWLNVGHDAITDLNERYRHAYGGIDRHGGIDGMDMQGGIDGMAMQGSIEGSYFGLVPEALSSAWSDDEDDGEEDQEDQEDDNENAEYHDHDSGVYVQGLPDSPTIHTLAECIPAAPAIKTTTSTPVPAQPKHSPSPKMPLLRVQTSFTKTLAAHRSSTTDEDEDAGRRHPEAEDNLLAALPDYNIGPAADARNHLWRSTQSTSINQILSPSARDFLLPPASRERDAPMTPNGYDDISPITRGEWGFIVDRRFKNARTVPVTTC